MYIHMYMIHIRISSSRVQLPSVMTYTSTMGFFWSVNPIMGDI